MNNLERDEAIGKAHDRLAALEARIEALEGHIHGADELHEFTDPPTIPVAAEGADVRHEDENG